MTSDEISSPAGSQEPEQPFCNGSKDCLAMAGGHLKNCPLYVVPASAKDSNRVITLPGDKRVFISGSNENTLGPIEGKRTNAESVDWELVASSITRMAQAATSPPGCIRRLYPTGASKKGRARSKPTTRVRKSQSERATAWRGRNVTSSKARQFSRSVTSPSAPPSR